MLHQTRVEDVNPEKIQLLLNNNYSKLLSTFYEMESSFLCERYKIHNNIESACIIMSFIKDVHLSIFRERERNLDHNVSLNNFFYNQSNIEISKQKIISIVKSTGIPKETVRRKVKQLIQNKYIYTTTDKEYFWKLSTNNKDAFVKLMNKDIQAMSKFIRAMTDSLNINLPQKIIENEIKKQFSFYFYHFLNCQVRWLKMWRAKINDIDLLFIAMQALIPTLKVPDLKLSHTVSTTSISDISGIPRATCIRKLDKLVKIGLLVREIKTKRYYVSQAANEKNKYMSKKENITNTLNYFSGFLIIIIKALIRDKI